MMLPTVKVYDIRGHHLVDITNYLHEGERALREYVDKGYGSDFVANMSQVFDNFVSGRALIQLTAGKLDAECRGNCQRMTLEKRETQEPCEGDTATRIDTKVAGFFLLEIGKTYSFGEIERNLRNFYADQHSM